MKKKRENIARRVSKKALQMSKNEIVTAARMVYMQVDEAGKRLNTMRDIEKLLFHKTGRRVSFSTIARWARDNAWEQDMATARIIGNEKAARLSAAETEQDKTRAVIDIVSDDLAERRQTALKKKRLADALIMRLLEQETERAAAGGKFKPDIDLRTLQGISTGEENNIITLDQAAGGAGNQHMGRFLEAVMMIPAAAAEEIKPGAAE